MQSRELLKSGLEQSYMLVMPLLEDLKTASLVPATAKGGNHAHWILGHLVCSEGQFRSMMRGVDNPVEHLRPLFAGGSTVDPEAKGYPSYAELLGQLVKLRAETMEWFGGLEENDLDTASKIVPPGFEPFFGTWRSCLLMQAMHWMNHRGQLADCRRSAGREKLMA